MKAKTWAPAVLAVVLGGAAAKLVRDSMMKPHAAPAQAAAVSKTMQVVIANNDLIVGQELRMENLSISTIQTPATPVDYCTNPAELVGRVLTTPVLKGQEVHAANLAPRGAAPTLPSLVPAGMRAMTINVDEANSLAGMLTPGCHVDVVGTFPNGKKSVTRRLVKNVLIQAVGTRLTSAKSEDGKEIPFHTVTVIVTPREAQIIDLTSMNGKVRLLLCPLNRGDGEADPGNVMVGDIDGGEAESAVSVGTTRPSTIDDGFTAPETRVVELSGPTGSKKVEFNMTKLRAEAGDAGMKDNAIPGTDNQGD